MQTKLTVNNVNNSILTFGSYCLDIECHELSCNDQIIPLTSGEFSLLKIFLEHSGKVLSRDRLLEITKGYTHSSIDRSIDVCVGRVRRKIEPDPSNPVYLRTIRGVGYLFSKEGVR
jgi:two-component system phosphate regulon response regulator OmpR